MHLALAFHFVLPFNSQGFMSLHTSGQPTLSAGMLTVAPQAVAACHNHAALLRSRKGMLRGWVNKMCGRERGMREGERNSHSTGFSGQRIVLDPCARRWHLSSMLSLVYFHLHFWFLKKTKILNFGRKAIIQLWCIRTEGIKVRCMFTDAQHVIRPAPVRKNAYEFFWCLPGMKMINANS